MKRRIRVYIAGPISKGDLKHNVDQATAAFVALAKAGAAPLCPHWSVYSKPAFLFPGPGLPDRRVFCEATAAGGTDLSHADWLGVDLAWVETADYLLRLPGESTGADAEVAHARANGIAVFDAIEPLLELARLGK